MAERAFAIRLSAKGMEQTRAALKGMGADGAAALREIDKANRQVTPGLKALDTAARDVRAEFDRFADQVPVIGGALKALGPAGIAAGAGLVGIGLGAKAVWDVGQKAREALDDLKTSADNIGTSAETFQVLSAAALEADINVDKLTEAMGKLQLSAALASKGKGELAETLKKLNPELLKEIALAETQEDRWNIVSRAITAQTSQVEKVIIAKAAFGEQGGKLVRLLDGEDKSLESLTARYKELGLVLDEELVASIAEADRRMDLANKRMEIDGVRAGAAMVPVIEAISSAWNGAWINLGNYLDSFNEIEHRQAATLKTNIGDQAKQVEFLRLQLVAAMKDADTAARGEGGLFGPGGALGYSENALAVRVNHLKESWLKARGELAELENAFVARTARPVVKGATSTGTEMGETPEEKAARERLAAELARKAAEALREQQALEKASIALRKEMGDWTGAYAEKQTELNKLVGQYGITQEMVNEQLAKFQSELDGSAAFAAKTAAAIEGMQTPAQKAHAELAAFVAEAVRLGKSTLPETILAIRVMSEAADALADSESAVAFAASEQGRALQAAIDGMMEARDAARAMREESLALNVAMDTTDAIFNEQLRTVEDWEDIVINAMKNVAKQAIYTASQVKGAGLGDIFGAVAGAFGFGGGSSSSGSGGGLMGIGQVVQQAFGKVSQSHTGGQVGDPSMMSRIMPIAPFINAPRFHTGFAPDEFPTVLQKDERVFSARHNERIVRAIEGDGASAPPKVELHFHGVEAQPEVKQTRQPNGDIRIDVMLEKKIVEVLGSNKAHAPMRKNFGLLPAAGV